MKTEKEKMLHGEFYFSGDSLLVEERIKVRKLLQEYNFSEPHDFEKRFEILKKIMICEGSCFIEPPFYCDYGYNIRVGKNFYANFSCTILDVCEVKIGNDVMFGPHVQIYTATHPLIASERAKGLEFGKPIEIGDHVWIGGGAIICPGVKIGRNSTIGAGAVVTKDVEENVFVAGNPAKVIKRL